MRQVTLLFLVRDDEILLAMKKRGFGVGHWNGCGGKLDAGETVEQALIRECQEEIGVTPTKYEKVAIHDFIMESHEDFEAHTFVATEWEGEPIETEEMAPRWFKKTDIPYQQMWPDDIVWLPAVLQGKKLRTSFVFDAQNNMTTANLTFTENLA